MSNIVVWGTSLSSGIGSLRNRITSDGVQRVTDDGTLRVAYAAPSQVVRNRVTSDGQNRVTDLGIQRVTISGLLGPSYFQSDDVTSDGGEEFDLLFVSNPFQPAQQGGEAVFRWAHLSITWSMSATLLVSAIVDGSDAPVVLPNGDVLEVLPSTITLDQQAGTLQRKTQRFPVPLLRRVLRNGVDIGRQYLRGEQVQLRVQSIGSLGVGALMLNGGELDWQGVRKASYATVATP